MSKIKRFSDEKNIFQVYKLQKNQITVLKFQEFKKKKITDNYIPWI